MGNALQKKSSHTTPRAMHEANTGTGRQAHTHTFTTHSLPAQPRPLSPASPSDLGRSPPASGGRQIGLHYLPRLIRSGGKGARTLPLTAVPPFQPTRPGTLGRREQSERAKAGASHRPFICTCCRPLARLRDAPHSLVPAHIFAPTSLLQIAPDPRPPSSSDRTQP